MAKFYDYIAMPGFIELIAILPNQTVEFKCLIPFILS